MTWALKWACLVMLLLIPVLNIHFDFILCTYCMSFCCWTTEPLPETHNMNSEPWLQVINHESATKLLGACHRGKIIRDWTFSGGFTKKNLSILSKLKWVEGAWRFLRDLLCSFYAKE